MVLVLTLWQENDVDTHSLAKQYVPVLTLDGKMVPVLTPWQKKDVGTHSLTVKWYRCSFLDRKKMVSVLTPWQKICVDTHSLTENLCWYSPLGRKTYRYPLFYRKKARSSNYLTSAEVASAPFLFLQITKLLIFLFAYSGNIVGINNKFCLPESSFCNFIIVLSLR